MKTWLAAVAMLLALYGVSARAQLSPYQYQPMAGTAQYGVNIGSVTTLTFPSGAIIAEICVNTANARYTTTGTTPTSSVGIPVAPQSATVPTCFQLAGAVNLTAFKIIGAGATMDVEYFK
jgi:hypothetical protein